MRKNGANPALRIVVIILAVIGAIALLAVLGMALMHGSMMGDAMMSASMMGGHACSTTVGHEPWRRGTA